MVSRSGWFVSVFVCVIVGLFVSTSHAISESFATSIGQMFRSQPFSRHPNLQSYMTMHEKKLASLKESSSKDNISQRETFILRLIDDCGMDCHDPLTKAFNQLDPSAHYQIISHSFAYISTSTKNMVHFFQSQEDYVLSQRIIEFTPLIAPLKVDFFAQEKLYIADDQDDHSCAEYYVIPAVLAADEIDSFKKKIVSLQELYQSVAQFELELDHLVPNEMRTIALKFSPVSSDPNGYCHVRGHREVIDALTQLPEVTWMERKYNFKTFNRWARGTCQTGVWNNVPLYSAAANITGDGEIIGVADTGIDMSSCYFHDPDVSPPFDTLNLNHRKVVYYNTFQDNIDDEKTVEAHGTHVAGSVAGFAASGYEYGDFPKYNGLAYHSKIAFFDIQKAGTSYLVTPSDLNNDLFGVLYNVGARIMTNSWGDLQSSTYGYYTSNAVAVDTFMWNHPEALVLFAAGNTGGAEGSSVSYSKTVAPPSTNKNGICVGASLSDHKSWLAYSAGTANEYLDIDSLAYFSSRGPTQDGRIKPDIVAPGFYTTSAKGLTNSSTVHCSIQALSGTSMATPTVAGLAAIVRQYFIQGFYPSGKKNAADSFVPSGALIKAMIVASGEALAQIPAIYQTTVISITKLSNYPDSNQGYGRVELDNILQFGASAINPVSLYVVGAAYNTSSKYASLQSRRYRVYTFTTSSETYTNPIRIVLAYTDYPGTASTSGSASVMVNTLTLTVKSSTGVKHSPYSSGSNLLVVDIASPLANTVYTVNVSANALSRTQPYSLVIRGKITFLNDSFIDESASQSSSTVDRLKALGNANVSSGASYYIGSLAGICFVLAVISSYLYFKIRWKFNQENNGDDNALLAGIQASIRDSEAQQINRNLNGDHRE